MTYSFVGAGDWTQSTLAGMMLNGSQALFVLHILGSGDGCFPLLL
jgi:hypothetical protein